MEDEYSWEYTEQSNDINYDTESYMDDESSTYLDDDSYIVNENSIDEKMNTSFSKININ